MFEDLKNLIEIIMKKSILSIGVALTRSEQKEVHGGSDYYCQSSYDACSIDNDCHFTEVCQQGYCVCPEPDWDDYWCKHIPYPNYC